MTKLSKTLDIQERKYKFPYHYIPNHDKGYFSPVRSLYWGYEYLSYLFFIIEKIESMPFDSLLDVGCGDGRFLYELGKRSHKNLVGLDYSKRAINFAQAFNPETEFIVGDVKNTSLLDKKFDMLTLIETLEHIPPGEIPEFVGGLNNYLKDAGTLLISVPTNNIKVPSKHFQHFDFESLKNTIEPYFKIEECNYLNKKSGWLNIIERLMINRFFILNERHLLNTMFNIYIKNFLKAKKDNAKRICVICKKNKEI